MTRTPVKLSFEEYLTYDDGTDNRYELVNGELVEMPPATGKHEAIMTLLLICFYLEIQRIKQPWHVRPNGTEFQTVGVKTRRPDICIITEQQKQEIDNKKAVLSSPPVLAVEIVSPDYRAVDTEKKRDEYQMIGTPEYWTVDWDTNTLDIIPNVTVRCLVDEHYVETVFTGKQQIISHTFPELSLTVEQVLSA